ncbi:MAG: hypothetical protein ACQERU_07745 [Bacteroidota bacterium]
MNNFVGSVPLAGSDLSRSDASKGIALLLQYNPNLHDSLPIYKMNTEQLKSIPLHLKGNGNIIIYGNELKAGMYLYALIADEKVIDTKPMVLTD